MKRPVGLLLIFLLIIAFSQNVTALMLDDVTVDKYISKDQTDKTDKVTIRFRSYPNDISGNLRLTLNNEEISEDDYSLSKDKITRYYHILIDNSGSMREQDLAAIRKNVSYLLNRISRQDYAEIITVSNYSSVIYNLSHYAPNVQTLLNGVVREGNYSRIYDAVSELNARLMAQNSKDSPKDEQIIHYIVLFSDGEDIASRTTGQQMRDSYRDIPFYYFCYSSDFKPEPNKPLQEIAGKHGKFLDYLDTYKIDELFLSNENRYTLCFLVSKNEILKTKNFYAELSERATEDGKIIIDLSKYFVSTDHNDMAAGIPAVNTLYQRLKNNLAHDTQTAYIPKPSAEMSQEKIDAAADKTENSSANAAAHSRDAKTSDDENAKTSDGENAKSSAGENAKSSDDENAKISDDEKAKTSDDENAKTSDDENAKTSDDENAKTSDDENAKTSDDEKAKTSDDENAKTSDDENAKTSDDENANAVSETVAVKTAKETKQSEKDKYIKDKSAKKKIKTAKETKRQSDNDGKFRLWPVIILLMLLLPLLLWLIWKLVRNANQKNVSSGGSGRSLSGIDHTPAETYSAPPVMPANPVLSTSAEKPAAKSAPNNNVQFRITGDSYRRIKNRIGNTKGIGIPDLIEEMNRNDGKLKAGSDITITEISDSDITAQSMTGISLDDIVTVNKADFRVIYVRYRSKVYIFKFVPINQDFDIRRNVKMTDSVTMPEKTAAVCSSREEVINKMLVPSKTDTVSPNWSDCTIESVTGQTDKVMHSDAPLYIDCIAEIRQRAKSMQYLITDVKYENKKYTGIIRPM